MNKYLKKFSLIKEFTCHDYKFIEKIVNELNSGSAEILKIDNCSIPYKYNNKEIYKSIDAWRTYDTCTFFNFQYKEDGIECTAKICNGSLYDGIPESIRFRLYLKLPFTFVSHLEDYIDNGFEYYLDLEYEQYFEAKKEQWKEKRESYLLKD